MRNTDLCGDMLEKDEEFHVCNLNMGHFGHGGAHECCCGETWWDEDEEGKEQK